MVAPLGRQGQLVLAPASYAQPPPPEDKEVVRLRVEYASLSAAATRH